MDSKNNNATFVHLSFIFVSLGPGTISRALIGFGGLSGFTK